MLLCVGFAAGIAVVKRLTTAAQRWVGEVEAQAVTDTMFGIPHSKSVEVDLGYYEIPAFKDRLRRAQDEAPYRPKRIVSSLMDLTLNAVTLLTMAGLLFAYHWSVLPILVVASVPGVLLRLRYSNDFYTWERKATVRERRSAYMNFY